MNLRDLKYLVALADHKHFGRAATACFVSQPTLSTQIKKLEDELGVPLVERAPRKVMLTPAGREAAMRARSIVAEVEQMKEAARRSQGRKRAPCAWASSPPWHRICCRMWCHASASVFRVWSCC